MLLRSISMFADHMPTSAAPMKACHPHMAKVLLNKLHCDTVSKMINFLIILFAILATVGSIVGYRVIKHAKIPAFVKNVREMKKEIKNGKSISESLIYQTKEIFVGELVRDKWSAINLSLGDILGIEIKKSKRLLKSTRLETKKTHDLKPLGLLLMRWDERIGTELLVKYPEDLNVTEKTLMQLYATHEYSGEQGVINLTFGPVNVLSYYTGPESSYYVVLFLNLEDEVIFLFMGHSRHCLSYLTDCLHFLEQCIFF